MAIDIRITVIFRFSAVYFIVYVASFSGCAILRAKFRWVATANCKPQRTHGPSPAQLQKVLRCWLRLTVAAPLPCLPSVTQSLGTRVACRRAVVGNLTWSGVGVGWDEFGPPFCLGSVRWGAPCHGDPKNLNMCKLVRLDKASLQSLALHWFGKKSQISQKIRSQLFGYTFENLSVVE